MIVAFYNITSTSYDLSSGVPDLSIDYSNPLGIKDMEFIPGIKSIIELNGGLYQIFGAEVVRYENSDGEHILYSCHVEEANSYPTMTLPYNQDFDKMLNLVMRKKKIEGILS
jgi:hypothetical protein